MTDSTHIPNIKFRPQVQKATRIEIIDIGKLNARRASLDHDPTQPHRPNFNLILYFQKGQGTHFVDFNFRHFEKGSLIFVRKNQIHAFDLSSMPQGKAILFTDDYLGSLLNQVQTPLFGFDYLHKDFSPVLNLTPPAQESVNNLLTEMNQEILQGEPNSQIISHLSIALLLMMERERSIIQTTRAKVNAKQQQKVTDFLALVEQQFNQTRNANDYAQQLFISYKTLNQFCKLVTDQTAKQLIDGYTILEAKRRLVLENKPIQTLAHELGFDEETNFVKYFKKQVLVTPANFRKSRRYS